MPTALVDSVPCQAALRRVKFVEEPAEHAHRVVERHPAGLQPVGGAFDPPGLQPSSESLLDRRLLVGVLDDGVLIDRGREVVG